MRRSELEIHIDILKALAREGPLKVTHIMYKANVWYDILKKTLDLLIQQNLVEKRTSRDRKVVYAITPKGLMVIKNLRQIHMNMPLTEEKGKIAALLY